MYIHIHHLKSEFALRCLLKGFVTIFFVSRSNKPNKLNFI